MIKQLISKYYLKYFGIHRSHHKKMRYHFPPHFQGNTLGFYLILKYIDDNNIEGDIVECGVGRGVSLFTIGNISNLIGLNKKIYGFDSFQGFPQPTVEDKSPRNPIKGEWGNTSVSHVADHFLSANKNWSDEIEVFYKKYVKLVPGYFENTLPVADLDCISFLHLDCDLYQSYKTCSEFLTKRLVTGSIVLYDEYNHSKWPGATKAINESIIKFKRNLFYSKFNKKYFSFDNSTMNSAGFLKLNKQLNLKKIEI
jgi:hypothetical protein